VTERLYNSSGYFSTGRGEQLAKKREKIYKDFGELIGPYIEKLLKKYDMTDLENVLKNTVESKILFNKLVGPPKKRKGKKR
jgi:Mor family transcriptional regulator